MLDNPLPRINPAVVDAILDMLLNDQGMNRPPVKAAELLALIVELHNQNRPFPPRAEVAKHINASIATVDAALSTRLDEGYIKVAIETRHGSVSRRNGVVRDRYYIPSAKLRRVAERADRGPA